jgi:hypothetical protein
MRLEQHEPDHPLVYVQLYETCQANFYPALTLSCHDHILLAFSRCPRSLTALSLAH